MDIGTLPTAGCQSLMHSPKMATVQYLSGDCNSAFKWIGKPIYDYLHNRVLLRQRSGLDVKTAKTRVEVNDLTAGIEQAPLAGAGQMLLHGSKVYDSPPT
jgi:hypothetical protein